MYVSEDCFHGFQVFVGVFAAPQSLDDLTDIDYLKFGIPMLIVLLIRFAAWQRSRQPGT